MNDTDTPAAAWEPAPPSWYPLSDWEPNASAWFFVPPEHRPAYSAVDLPSEVLRGLLEPTKAPVSQTWIAPEDLPEGLSMDPATTPEQEAGGMEKQGYLRTDGSLPAAVAVHHSRTLADVRAAQQNAIMLDLQMRARLRACVVCGDRRDVSETLPVEGPGLPAGLAACGPCHPVALAAIATVRGGAFLRDGRTRTDAAIGWALSLGLAE